MPKFNRISRIVKYSLLLKYHQNILTEKSRLKAQSILKSHWSSTHNCILNIKYGQQWLRFTHMFTRLSFPLRLNLLRQLHLPLVPPVAWQTELCKVLKKVWQSITDISLLAIQKNCVCVPRPTKCWQVLCFCGLIALNINIIIHDNSAARVCVWRGSLYSHNKSACWWKCGWNPQSQWDMCWRVRSWFWHQIISNTHSISVWHTHTGSRHGALY